MAKTQDLTAVFKDMMGAFPVDTKAMEDAFKTQTSLTEKLSGVALDAAKKSTDLSAKWANDTLAKLATVSKAKADPADYAKSMTDFASASAEAAAEHMAAYAEIARKVQTETLELVLAAGKKTSEEMTSAAQKATADLTAAAQKAAAEVTTATKKATEAAK
ncbi:phasin family protein [Marivivens marinus]|uniref:phasin family protein n=1 Tax=Marivivens marinus TaxID=3110173 RepID=UPI003B84A0D1